jgi:hypothetical protein
MSESPEPTIQPASATDASLRAAKPNGLRRAVTWVGIVAGSIFAVTAIFVAGAATGWLPAWHEQHGPQVMSMPRPGAPPMGPTAGDKCCCEKMAKK